MSPVIRKPCPGCKVTLIAAPTRRCPACSQAYELARGSRQARGYDNRQHAKWRQMVLATYETCVDCGAAGQPNDHADHVVALAAGGDWSIENGARRCARCHGRKTALFDGGFGNAPGAVRNYRTPPSAVPCVIVLATNVGVAYPRAEDQGA